MLKTSKLSETRGSLDAMYRFMATIGAHKWCLTPLELCWLHQPLSWEMFWITYLQRPLNDKLPTKGTNKWRKPRQFRLYTLKTIAGQAANRQQVHIFPAGPDRTPAGVQELH